MALRPTRAIMATPATIRDIGVTATLTGDTGAQVTWEFIDSAETETGTETGDTFEEIGESGTEIGVAGTETGVAVEEADTKRGRCSGPLEPPGLSKPALISRLTAVAVGQHRVPLARLIATSPSARHGYHSIKSEKLPAIKAGATTALLVVQGRLCSPPLQQLLPCPGSHFTVNWPRRRMSLEDDPTITL